MTIFIFVFKFEKGHFQNKMPSQPKQKNKTKKYKKKQPKKPQTIIRLSRNSSHEISDSISYWEEKQICMHEFTLHWLLSHRKYNPNVSYGYQHYKLNAKLFLCYHLITLYYLCKGRLKVNLKDC